MYKQNKILTKKRKAVLKKVIKIGPFIEGTLAVTQRMCGAKKCTCLRGKKHKAMYLTWKEKQETRSMYVPVRRQEEALEMSRNYKKVKKLIRILSNMNKKSLARKKMA